MHFTRRFALVFFGRELEVRELLDRLSQPKGRFVIVSGDSGCGKSSLVDAGVLARLEDRAAGHSTRVVRMVPSGGSDPFDALRTALDPLTQRAGLDGYRLERELADPQAQPADVVRVLGDILARGLDADRLVLFIDQMEELLTAPKKDPALVNRFLSGLYATVQTQPLQVIATIRSDLLHHCYGHEDLLRVLNGRGHYALGQAAHHNLHDMIVQPARCAGVDVPEALVQVDIEGLPTRRRARRANLPSPLDSVVEALIKARLLAPEGKGKDRTLSVAHERLFQAWPRPGPLGSRAPGRPAPPAPGGAGRRRVASPGA